MASSPMRQAWDQSHVDAAKRNSVDMTARPMLLSDRWPPLKLVPPAPQEEAAKMALESASRRGSSEASQRDGKRLCSVFTSDSENLEDQFLQLYEKDDWATPRPKWQNSLPSREQAALLAEQRESRNRLKILISTGRIAAATQEVVCRAETHEARSKKAHGIDQKVRSNMRAMGEQRLELSSARKDLEGVLNKNKVAKSNVASFIQHLLPTPRSMSKDADSSVVRAPTSSTATQAQIREAAQQPATNIAGAAAKHTGYAAGAAAAKFAAGAAATHAGYAAKHVGSGRRWSVAFDLGP